MKSFVSDYQLTMARKLNKSSRYFLQNAQVYKLEDDPNLVFKCKTEGVYIKPESSFYRKGMPTIPKYNEVISENSGDTTVTP